MTAKKFEKLTAAFVRNVTAPGKYGDGGNLYLLVKESGAKSWVYRYWINGREKTAGLGPVGRVGLTEARERAREIWTGLKAGIDPLAAKAEARATDRAKREEEDRAAARRVTFARHLEIVIAAKRNEWKVPEREERTWRDTLAKYAAPLLEKDVADITTDDVVEVLLPVWGEVHVTAEKVRQRIHAVLDSATALGLRTGANPARLKGHIDRILGKPKKVHKAALRPSLPYQRCGDFVRALRKVNGITPRLIEFAIYTGARSQEVRLTRWRDIDLDARVWNRPAEIMKPGAPHSIPLSDRAVEILRGLPPGRPGDYVFPGKDGEPVSDNVSKIIRDMNKRAAPGERWVDPEQGNAPVVLHGFRSSFRTFLSEETEVEEKVAEYALSHDMSAVEKVYNRGKLRAKLTRAFDVWADYLDRKAPANVVNIDRKKEYVQ